MDSSEPYMASISPFAGTYAPRNWALCVGTAYDIRQFQAIFALIGNTFGGDVAKGTFQIPDLRCTAVSGAIPAVPAVPASGTTPASDAIPTNFGVKNGYAGVLLARATSAFHTHDIAMTMVSAGVGVGSGNGSLSTPTAGAVLANAVQGTTTTGVNIYAPISGATGVSSLPMTVTGATVTVHIAGATQLKTVPLFQPMLGVNMCFCMDGVFPTSG